MTAAFSAAFLDLTSPAGETMARWQSRWIGATVSHEGQPWAYRDFDWDGIPSGAQSDAAQVGLRFIGLPNTLTVLMEAQDNGWSGRLRVYQYPVADDGPSPPGSMVLVGSPRGLVSIQSISITEIRVSLASAQIARGGAAFPPRTADQSLIGISCVLEV